MLTRRMEKQDVGCGEAMAVLVDGAAGWELPVPLSKVLGLGPGHSCRQKDLSRAEQGVTGTGSCHSCCPRREGWGQLLGLLQRGTCLTVLSHSQGSRR